MVLFNITPKVVDNQVEAVFHSDDYAEAKKVSASLIHWIPYGTGVKTSIVMPSVTQALIKR